MFTYTNKIFFNPSNMGRVLPASGIGHPKRKEKWVTLPNENLSLMPLMDVDVEMLLNGGVGETSSEFLELGAIYALDGGKIEGVELNTTLFFRLYRVIHEYKGVELNSLVMKEVHLNDEGKFEEGYENSTRRKFSISPSMCKMLGIEFQPGYELWSMAEPFIKVKLEDKTQKVMSSINYGDLSTYPTSEVDGTIRKIILELHGFSPFNNDQIITPTGALIKTEDLLNSMVIFTRQNISTDNGCAGYKEGTMLPFKVVARRNNDSKTVTICDDKHNIYVEVDLSKQSQNAMTSDGIIGVAHTALDGKDIDDVIGVKWDESSVAANIEEANKQQAVEVDVDKVMNALGVHFGHNRQDIGINLGTIGIDSLDEAMRRLGDSMSDLQDMMVEDKSLSNYFKKHRYIFG